MTSPRTHSAPAEDKRKPRVVVVDDEESIRFTFRRFLEHAGYAVSEAQDASSARQVFAQGVDVAVIDVLLGPDSGFDLLEDLKARIPCVSAIMITGLPEQETISRALNMGAFDYLAKPVTRERLLMAVERAVANCFLLQDKLTLEEENLRYRERLEQLVDERTRQLEASQRLMARTVACLQEAVFIISANDFRILDVNPAAERIFGYQREELIGISTDMLHVDAQSLANFRTMMHSGIKEHGVFHLDAYRMRRRDGSLFPTEHTVTPMTDADGCRTAWVSVVRDVTERTRAREELEESRSRFKLLSESSFAGVAVHDQGVLLEANDQYFAMFGYQPEELLGKQAMAMTVADDCLDQVRERVIGGDKGPYRCRGIRRDKSEIPLEIQVREVTYKGRWVRAAVMIDLRERNAAQMALASSEATLRALINESNEFILLLTPKGRVLMINRQAENHLGLDEREILGKSIFDLFPPQVAAGRMKILEFATGRAETVAYCDYFQPAITFESVMTPIKDDNGQVIRVALFARDATEQRSSGSELARSEKLYRLLAENAHDVIWTQDMAMRFTYLSPSVERVFGWNPDDFAILPEDRLFPPETRERITSLRNELLKQAQGSLPPSPFRQELAYLRRDGSLLWGDSIIIPLMDHTGTITGLQWSIRDVTGRHQAEQAQAEGEMRFRLLFESAGDMVVLLDSRMRIADINRAGCDLMGHERDQLLGRPLKEIDPQALHGLSKQLASITAISPLTYSTSLLRRDGSQLPVTIRVQAVELRGQPALLAVIRDDLQGAVHGRSESRLLAAVSHEVRTPLYGVMGMLQLMSLTPLNDEQQEYLNLAEASAKGLLTVTEDMLDLSRLTSGMAAITAEEFSLNALVGAVSGVLGQEAAMRGVTLRHVMDRDVPDRVTGDAARIRQALFHILGAALKCIGYGEVLMTVRVDDAENPPQYHSIPLAFSVTSDTLDLPLDNEPLTATLAQGFARSLGGSLRTSPRELTLSVNLGRAGTAPRAAEASRAAMGGTPLRVLVAEDNPVNRLLVSRLLTRMGHSVRAVENGSDAVDALSMDRFDCVLMDIMMPVMDGLEALEAIRAGKAGPDASDIPVIALTAQALRGDRERILDAGMTAYLAKPVDVESLARAIERVVVGGEREPF